MNGTEKAHEYKRRQTQKKKTRDPATVSFAERLMQEKDLFASKLSSLGDKLEGKIIGIWDTECDAVGGGHALADVREWFYYIPSTAVRLTPTPSLTFTGVALHSSILR